MKARRPKKMFPLILNFRWRKFILTYDFSDFGLVFVVNLPHLFRFVKKKKKKIEHKLCYKQSWIYSKEHLWRRRWHPTPVLLPGESHGRGSLMGCRLWGRTELDMTEAT